MLGLTPVTLQRRTINLDLFLWINTCAYINGIICYYKCGIVKFHRGANIHGVGQGLWSSGEFWPRGGILPSHACFSYNSVFSIMQTYNQIKAIIINLLIKFNGLLF